MACTPRLWKIFVRVALLMAVAPGCASNPQSPTDLGQGIASANLTGMVTCQVRVVLPQDSYVQVELVDISRQNAPARTIAMQDFPLKGRQFPIPFVIAYGPATIDPSHIYAVQVRVLIGNRLLFKNSFAYKVLTNGVRSNAEIVVEPVPGSGF